MVLPNKARPFTHRIHVDFSGDDGDPRTAGASRCLLIAWVLSAESDLSHNQSVVLQIKKVIGCRPNAELKYRALRRHRRKNDALELLSHIKASVVLVAVLKERITEEELRSPKTKKLVNLIHYFPLSRFLDYFKKEYPDVYFQLVFDEVGWAGCESEITKSFKEDRDLDWGKARPDWLEFKKSGGNLMLQLADVVAGLGREYIEGVQILKRPPCIVCWLKGIRDCSYKRNKKPVGKAGLMRVIYPLLLKDNRSLAWERGLLVRPPGVEKDYLFVDCLFGGK